MTNKQDVDRALPRSLALLWGRTKGRRAAPRALSLERIVAAAIKIADAQGIHALSMAHLAQRLGCATMSLYRHVANKDELQVFMMDTAPGPPPALEARGDWRSGLEQWARALQAVYYRHPWILQITTGRPPLEPGQLAWLDCGLRCLSRTKLDPDAKLAVILLIVNYVRGEAQSTSVMLQTQTLSAHDHLEREHWYARTLAQLVDPERFPALAELCAAGSFNPKAGDAGARGLFDFGLARMLDGIALLVRPRSPTARRGGRTDLVD